MKNTKHNVRILICALFLNATSLFGGINMQVRDGRPIIDGVYVNGHGPYRFLVDTGSNINLIEANLARSIGLMASFRTELATSTGVTVSEGSGGIALALGPVKVVGQQFLFSGLEALHRRWPDIQGALGQAFLAQFDYTLDMRNKRLEFGRRDAAGTRALIKTITGRLALSSNLGDLVLDSGIDRLILFGVKPDGPASTGEIRTFAGSQQIGFVSGKALIVGDRKIWRGDAVAIPSRPEEGVDGLLPLILFRTIYVCNSEGYVVFD